MQMDIDIFQMYVLGMRQVEHEEMIKDFTTESYMNIKADDRKKLHKNTYKCAFPSEFNNPKNLVKLSDLNKVLK